MYPTLKFFEARFGIVYSILAWAKMISSVTGRLKNGSKNFANWSEYPGNSSSMAGR